MVVRLYKEDLDRAGLSAFVIEKDERERYMFGNDGIKESFLHVVAPAIVAAVPSLWPSASCARTLSRC